MSLIDKHRGRVRSRRDHDTDGWDGERVPRPVVNARNSTPRLTPPWSFAGGTTIDQAGADPVDVPPKITCMFFSMPWRGWPSLVVDVVGVRLVMRRSCRSIAAADVGPLPRTSHVAACHWSTTTQAIDGHVQSEHVQVCRPDNVGRRSRARRHPPPTDSDLDAICVATAITIGEDPFAFCDESRQRHMSRSRQVWWRPRSLGSRCQLAELRIQPANGRTLVNFDTNFYTDTRPLTGP